MIQIMELVKIYYLIFRKWKSIYEEEKRQVQQTQIKLSINDTFYIMNLTYKVQWFDKTYVYLNVNIGLDTKRQTDCDSIIDSMKR